ncbi:molybdenum ABC transporter, periplasmic molybdate-binding protein [Magnetococcus marinus MC-1]|uniref:Molybdenum ABC transporter, periplasmic molybdate-binding protein n=1 Tax=Magnetococcus marinus (strain ATCC BAA-1437 / JCM 17883 / MC-1) TaxID=156889 RepID=A0L8E7_MAGMM|nr:molybdate ABC transporter substrate-binding protein [Magnetococcus marinus]ABK44240.1 molybdenum ABC transporter, periplasmic molybdate-binding protein [Magnetococcus marinus MC-1]
MMIPFFPLQRCSIFFMGLVLTALTLCPTAVRADSTNIAVAANFTGAAKEIAAAFAEDTGHQAVLSFGSTGKLYTQIAHGAPFHAFLAADRKRPEKAEAEGLAVAGSRFTYATGKIVLFSTDPNRVDPAGKVLEHPETFAKLAIANPKTAPYGAAARQTMQKLGLLAAIEPKLVRGDSIAQTYQFVATGNAQLGFVALSQVITGVSGSQWVVPSDLYTPIRQDVVLLNNGVERIAAKAFVDYLKGDRARAIIEKYGYGVE